MLNPLINLVWCTTISWFPISRLYVRPAQMEHLLIEFPCLVEVLSHFWIHSGSKRHVSLKDVCHWSLNPSNKHLFNCRRRLHIASTHHHHPNLLASIILLLFLILPSLSRTPTLIRAFLFSSSLRSLSSNLYDSYLLTLSRSSSHSLLWELIFIWSIQTSNHKESIFLILSVVNRWVL